MSVRNNIVVVTAAIGYLDCIDSSASDISRISQTLHLCIKVKDNLNCVPLIVSLMKQCKQCNPYTNDLSWNCW